MPIRVSQHRVEKEDLCQVALSVRYAAQMAVVTSVLLQCKHLHKPYLDYDTAFNESIHISYIK